MKLRLFAAVAALAAAAASSAGAVVVTLPNQVNQLYTATGQSILWDFDAIANGDTQFTGNERSHLGPPPAQISDSAPPPLEQGSGGIVTCCANGSNYYADPTDYGSVQAGGSSTFETKNGYYLTSFSFYMGSPDTYNHVTFRFRNGTTQTLDGDQIWGGGASGQAGNGDRSKGFRIYYDLEGKSVDKITFSTENTNAFEFDGLAGTLAIPEPATWALMIGGFGMSGAMLRRRRALAA